MLYYIRYYLGVLWMVHPHNVNTDPCTDLQNLGLGKPGGPAARQGGRVSFGASLTLCYLSIGIFYETACAWGLYKKE